MHFRELRLSEIILICRATLTSNATVCAVHHRTAQRAAQGWKEDNKQLQQDLDKFKEWMDTWLLNLYIGECKSMLTMTEKFCGPDAVPDTNQQKHTKFHLSCIRYDS